MSGGTPAHAVGVQATFYVRAPGQDEREERHAFAKLTPLADVPPVTTSAPRDWPPYIAGSSAYSGRHDGGLLPPLKEGGPYGALLEAVQEARRDSDAYMTGVIKEVYGGAAGGDSEGEQQEEEEGMEVDNDDEAQAQDDGGSQGNKAHKGKELVGAGGGKARSGNKKPKI